ncbi:uncharacterized protein LAESUDRAFT_804143 [Laetiporus sulphureus 93-53]|uniref:Uncharacterized protein n=1 Tax=Laetiporus sulphureus 93-53 TaxID=1314785 RepID=A0A165B3B4_9APHY|nr:uncharacterized protein LAESUDRAFT_804143 [Laetiporus sulphureus 93-53]KZT00142.1 hypothetical protein LAESUDRAFT_804143 [Laetiporus sulphureus 93-53]
MPKNTDYADSHNPYRMPYLTEDNWLPWKRRVQHVWKRKRLTKYVTGEIPILQPLPDIATAEEKAAREAEIADWEDKDSEAAEVMLMSMADDQLIHVSESGTSHEIWESLRIVKKKPGHHGLLAHQHMLYQPRAPDDKDMDDWLKELCQLREKLHQMGKLIPDDEFVSIILMSLLESWDSFMNSYFGAARGQSQSGNGTQITSQDLIAVIRNENCRRKS